MEIDKIINLSRTVKNEDATPLFSSIPRRTSVIAEVYPSIFRRRFTKIYKSGDEHDAYSITRWLQEMDSRGVLSQYFNPPLTKDEMDQAKLEGWILGVY
jgi:hypothetical protein